MVALGRALMLGTRLLILDEPFQGLAPVLAQRYAEALRRLRSQDKDITLLITELNPKLLETFADVTLTIERGEIERPRRQLRKWLPSQHRAGHRNSTLLRIVPARLYHQRNLHLLAWLLSARAEKARLWKGRIFTDQFIRELCPRKHVAHPCWHEPCIEMSRKFIINEGHHARYSRRRSLQQPALPGKGRHHQLFNRGITFSACAVKRRLELPTGSPRARITIGNCSATSACLANTCPRTTCEARSSQEHRFVGWVERLVRRSSTSEGGSDTHRLRQHL